MLAIALLIAAAPATIAQDSQGAQLEARFRAASADFDAGRFAQAAAQLEALLPQAPKSFEIQELLGLAYASESQPAELSKAIPHLEAAVRLRPNSAEARTNLAASLTHAGQPDRAGEQFRKALALEPRSYDANHNLAGFLLQSGKVAEARPYLEQAQLIDPSRYDNGYNLALADFLTGRLPEARQLVQSLLAASDTGELHNLLGQIEEKDGNFLAAESEFQTAAHLDPSEDNLFAWGTELLLHRTYGPAMEVFAQAARRYPQSPRIHIGLGMALDLGGHYAEAVTALVAAADLSPSDARCYLFLSKAYGSSPDQADEVIERFRRYAALKPRDAEAQYLYAMSIWKGRRLEEGSRDMAAIESLLLKAIALDPSRAEAHFQLGNLYAGRQEYAKALPEHLRAVALNANSADAHYRLAQDYVHAGSKELAKRQFDLYSQLRAAQLAESDKEKAEVQQFVLSEQAAASTRAGGGAASLEKP